MGVIELGNVIANSGLGKPLRNAGAPVAAVNDVQTLTGTATGGTFALTLTTPAGTVTTAALAFNISAAALQTALQALANVGGANVTCSGGALGTNPIVVTFVGTLAGLTVTPMVIDNTLATGGTVTIAHTTPGVSATFEGKAPTGALMIDTTNAILYQNTGTAAIPVWSKVGLET